MPLVSRITALMLVLATAPALAQNAAAPSPAPATPPVTTTTPPPVTVAPPPVENSVAPAPAQNVSSAPAAPPPPPDLVTIDPDAAYPNGFADPVDPFANDAAMAQRDEGGFPWGLLGLLGLLGLIPLFRRGGKTRTVYVDSRDPKRVLREEIDD